MTEVKVLHCEDFDFENSNGMLTINQHQNDLTN